MRIFDRDIQILGADGTVLRRHPKSTRNGSYTLDPQDRLFNPSRETLALLTKLSKVGPHTARLGDC